MAEQIIQDDPQSIEEFMAQAKAQSQGKVRIAIVGDPTLTPYRIRVEAYNKFYFDTVTEDLSVMDELKNKLLLHKFKVAVVDRQPIQNKIPKEMSAIAQNASRAGLKRKRSQGR